MAELFKVNAPVRKPLFEGVQGENEARSIQFDVTPWVEELGDGAVTATAKRSQDSQPYPVTVTKVGNVVTWKPTSTDTAFAGVGSFQLEYTVGGVLAKTCIWSTMVAPSLDPAGDPPDPYDNWLAEMRQIAADALQSEQNAENSAEDAEAWAVGQRGGVDVPSTDPTYENNAKYWAEQSLANQYSAFIVKSASGDIASFNDGADDVPMKSVNVTITPQQAGSGDPSPSNVRPITGTSTANVTVEGVNLWDEEIEDGSYDPTTGEKIVLASNNRNKNPIAIVPNATHYTNKVLYRFYYDKDMNYISQDNTGNFVFTPPANARYMNIRQEKSSWDGTNTAINYPASDTEYHPYTGHTTPVPLGQTVYGGTVNPISGVLTIDKLFYTFTGTEAISYGQHGGHGRFQATVLAEKADDSRISECNCSHYLPSGSPLSSANNVNNAIVVYQKRALWRDDSKADADAMKAYMAAQYANGTPVQLAYVLATPTTVQLTPTQVASLLGTNNVWADCGSVAVEYRADPTLAYAELQALILENL